MAAAPSPARPTVERADRSHPLPLSSGQQQMWLLHQLAPTSRAYLMTWTLRLTGPLDTEALRRAWERLVTRHEILRTRYQQIDDEPHQIVDPPGPFALRVVDLAEEPTEDLVEDPVEDLTDGPAASAAASAAAYPAADREERARQIAEWERRRPFDLTRHQPVRVTLIALGPDVHLMVVNIHHIAADEDSYQVIVAELAALYGEESAGTPAGLDEPPVQYADFAARERARTTDAALRTHLTYWRDTLKDVRDLPLPLDRPRPARADRRGGLVELTVAPATAAGVRALASAGRATPFMVLLAAYHVMLARLTGSDDVAVGLPVSTRTPDLDGLLGYTVNTVVVRTRHTAGQNFTDVVARIREGVLDAFDHRFVPFKRVVDEVNPARGLDGNPLFQAAFDMEAAGEDGGFRLPGLTVERTGSGVAPDAKFDLNMHVAATDDGRFVVRLEYAAAVLDEATVQGWAAAWEPLLDALVRDPLAPLPAPGGSSARPGVQPAAEPAAVAPGPGTTGPTPGGARSTAALTETLHRIWAEVLELDAVGPQDNFFDVGGDSLRAVALSGRLRAEGLEVSATDIFAYQSIEELAEWCAEQTAGTGPDQPVPLAPFAQLSPADRAALPSGTVDAYPLTATQLGMLIELRARPDVNTYQDTTSYLVRDEESLDHAALQQAAQLVVDRHEVLRTGFDLNRYSVPLQLVHRTARIDVGVTDHGVLGPGGWRPALEEYAAGERRNPMDTAAAPLIRVHGHRAEDAKEWWITITECHPILEGFSFHTMLMEILTGYYELRAGRTPAEPEPVPFRYADHVAAEAAARESEEHRAYWRGVVEGRTGTAVPTAWQGDRALARERYQHMLDFRDLEDDLRRLASETGTSMKAVLLAAHMKVMSAVAATEDFYTGLVCDTRPEVLGADRVLGMYLNTLPFAMPTGARTWGGLVKAVYDGLTGLWPHRVFPMQVIQQEFGPGGRLLDVFFNYLDFRQVDKSLIDEDATYNDNDNEFALHVFTISGILKLNTTSHRLSRAAAVRLTALYRAVLERMALGPEGDARADCLPARERESLRVLDLRVPEWPAPDQFAPDQLAPDQLAPDRTTDPADGLTKGLTKGLVKDRTDNRPETVTEAFARVLAAHPDDPALRHGDRVTDYRQLDARAEEIARGLRDRGAGPGSLVAVAPERGPDTVAAVLAVWRLGACFGLAPDASGGPDLPALPVLPVLAQPAVITGDTACVLPGTPGAPGAAVTHHALARALHRVRTELDARGAGSGRGSSWLCAAPPVTSAGLVEVLAALTSGACAVLTTAPLPESVPEMRDHIEGGRVTHLWTTPLVAERVLDPAPQPVTVLLGGDVHAGPAPAAGLRSRARVIDVLGADGLVGPVAFDGRPAHGLALRIADDRLRRLPVGVVGELCVDDPDAPGSRPHRTGRLARLGRSGRLEPLGPVGSPHRTGELLGLHPSVRDCRVLVRQDPAQSAPRLLGYVRTATEEFTPDEVRRALAERRLPRHLIPDALVVVDEWPLTASGTVDEDRLPEPTATPTADGTDELPWDDGFEGLLRDVLTAASFEGELEPDVPLADAGLNSMATVGLMVAVEQLYDIVFPDDFQVVDMFRTPRMLWEAINDLRADGI
ncbi:condensation domain-containing protein [Kitasatospora sp. NBC_00458]|uniref:condensation domain-containing protein n=1 Tax=Kitasatospora sp. NBC_00458 TaxID=2903568 RepID=UPI002E193225